MNKMHKQNKTSHATLQRKEILEFAATKVKRSNVLSTISQTQNGKYLFFTDIICKCVLIFMFILLYAEYEY